MLFLSSLLLFYFNEEIYILLKKRIKKCPQCGCYLVQRAFSSPQVIALRFPHTWLFLMEARWEVWPWLGINIYQLPLQKLCPPLFWTTTKKRKVTDNLKARAEAGIGVKSPKRQLELLHSLHGSCFCLNSKLLLGLAHS